MATTVSDGGEPVAVLQRWEDLGAVWRVVGEGTAGETVALCRCDGGEEVQRFTSDDPVLLDFLGGRTSEDETGPGTAGVDPEVGVLTSGSAGGDVPTSRRDRQGKVVTVTGTSGFAFDDDPPVWLMT